MIDGMKLDWHPMMCDSTSDSHSGNVAYDWLYLWVCLWMWKDWAWWCTLWAVGWEKAWNAPMAMVCQCGHNVPVSQWYACVVVEYLCGNGKFVWLWYACGHCVGWKTTLWIVWIDWAWNVCVCVDIVMLLIPHSSFMYACSKSDVEITLMFVELPAHWCSVHDEKNNNLNNSLIP